MTDSAIDLGRNIVRVANGTWLGDEARVFRLGFGLLPPAELAAALDALTSVIRRAARAAA